MNRFARMPVHEKTTYREMRWDEISGFHFFV